MLSLVLVLLAAAKSPPTHRPGSVTVIAGSAPRWHGAPISLDLKDADLVDVCRTFADIAKTNIVVDPGVKGSVTVRLRDVPWDQALDLILRMNGYASVRDGNILRIGTPEALAR